MKTTGQSSVYGGGSIHQRMERLAELVRLAGNPPRLASSVGRNAFTRFVDATMIGLRRRARPAYRAAVSFAGLAMFVYVWTVGRTARLATSGARKWPDIPDRAVTAIWHGCAPSLLAAVAKRRPRGRLVILITTAPRGDVLDVLCRLLGFEVVRGDAEHHGWPSLARVAEAVAGGACAVITPDGGAPRRVARAGVVALAAAAGAPVVALGVESRPGIDEPHKWDRARNPVPFGRIAVCVGEPMISGDFVDGEAMEEARQKLQRALDAAQREARQALGLLVNES